MSSQVILKGKYMDNKKIFALDIGTRSVTGIILEKQDKFFKVIDFCIKEHKNRSMLDGQIHDVVEVANIITAVKEQLEIKNGVLHQVCVAAAGRALQTMQSEASMTLQQQPIMNTETIKHLELSAVKSSFEKLATEGEHFDYTNYYCVGYSTLNYKLDGESIGSLIDQSGKEASVDIIAAFLPKVVVDSLLAALTRAGLEMSALTLEPIAAINVVIPESMRRLNVALIDIGAGTSDIAITSQGTITAYGMVPMAGDEITEKMSDQYLLDFPEAEQTKRNIVTNGEDVVSDILGFETTITYKDLMQEIHDSVINLAKKLAAEILQLNKQAPRAIMLIGGGSLTPEITKELANQLELPLNRVAVRGIDAIQNLQKNDALPTGPDFITPIGIAITASENPIRYINVTVNDKIVHMFKMKTLTIGDCLIQAGIDIKKLYGLPGLASIVMINGQKITVPGDYGGQPTIYLNHKVVSVDTIVQDGDKICIKRGRNGLPPNVSILDVVGDMKGTTVYFNDVEYTLLPVFEVNGNKESGQYMIKDKDCITIKQLKTINDLLMMTDIEIVDDFFLTVNGQQIKLSQGQTKLFINEQQVSRNHPVNNHDQIKMVNANYPVVMDLLQEQDKVYSQSIKVTFNGKDVIIKRKQLTVYRNDIELTKDTVLNQNDHITIIEHKMKNFIFQDVFRYVDIDLEHIKGTFKIYKNKQPASFHEVITDGDQLTLIWS